MRSTAPGKPSWPLASQGPALDCHTTALTLARQTGDRYQQARACHGLGDACHAAGQPGQARQHWQQARDLYVALGIPHLATQPKGYHPAVVHHDRESIHNR